MTFSVYAAAQARNPLGRPPPEPACFTEAPSEAEAEVEGSNRAELSKGCAKLGFVSGHSFSEAEGF